MKYLANPNLLYVGTFTIPFLVYTLGWSTLYPLLNTNLLLFYFFTFTVCLALAYITNRYLPFKFNYIPVSRYNVQTIVFIFLFFIADVIYAKRIPLFSLSSGEENYQGGQTFGIPTLHVIMVTFTLFYSLYTFHQYISNKGKKLFVVFLCTIVPFIFLLERSNIMYILIGSIFIYILSLKRIKVKVAIFVSVAFLSFIYIFGYLGNLRSANGDSTYIPRLSGVTDKFLNGPIPNEFYWGYLYIASPVAGLQNDINIDQFVKYDAESFVVYEMMPDFLNKKVGNYVDVHPRQFYQLNNFLNVGTIYANAFRYLSWPGMFIIFGYLMGLMNWYYIISPRLGNYKIAGIAMMFNLIAFSNFSNAIQFSAFSVQLIFPILLTVIKNLKLKPKKVHFISAP